MIKLKFLPLVPVLYWRRDRFFITLFRLSFERSVKFLPIGSTYVTKCTNNFLLFFFGPRKHIVLHSGLLCFFWCHILVQYYSTEPRVVFLYCTNHLLGREISVFHLWAKQRKDSLASIASVSASEHQQHMWTVWKWAVFHILLCSHLIC